MGKVISTLITIVVAVGASAALWVGANLVFNQVRTEWQRFSAVIFGAVGFVLGAILNGNQLLTVSTEAAGIGGLLAWLAVPVVFALAFAVVGVLLVRTDDPTQRLAIGVGAGALVGVVVGVLIDERAQPSLDVVPLLGWTVAGLVVGGGLSALRRRPPLNGLLVGGAVGWFVGAWGGADIGSGTMVEAVVAAAVPAILIGIRVGYTRNPDLYARTLIDQKSRGFIFLVPALLFIFITLVVPTVRTIYLSFFDSDADGFVGLGNYTDTFTDSTSWDASGLGNFFTSRLFYIGLVLVVIGAVLGFVSRQRTGRAVELGGPSVLPLLGGGLFLLFALFTALRGTIINNLWWVVTVTFFATAVGLAVAVLADGVRFERVAKSLIFMPMAISLVGATIIWRFMYVPRDTSTEQTGVMNAVWVGLGRLSTGEGIPTILVAILLGVLFVALLVVVGRRLVERELTSVIVPGGAALLVGWILLRYVTSGIGGFTETADGEIAPQTIAFVQESPFNNIWLMVVLIWIQTGFAMVILSAAIKAVPTEFIEAARVDGATESQIFWRVTLPQVATTIGVVVTTLIVLVMKVYDIVAVMTNGNFGTQVLANDMYNQAFNFANIGRGAALAVILFISVLPVMYMNVRRMQQEA